MRKKWKGSQQVAERQSAGSGKAVRKKRKGGQKEADGRCASGGIISCKIGVEIRVQKRWFLAILFARVRKNR